MHRALLDRTSSQSLAIQPYITHTHTHVRHHVNIYILRWLRKKGIGLFFKVYRALFWEHRSRVLYYTTIWMELDVLCIHMLIATLFSSMGAELFSIVYRPRLVYKCFESSPPFKKASHYSTLLNIYECSANICMHIQTIFSLWIRGLFQRV